MSLSLSLRVANMIICEYGGVSVGVDIRVYLSCQKMLDIVAGRCWR